MAVDHCFACVICDFMTFNHINLQQHFRLRHQGIPPKSVFKPVCEPICTIIAQMDEVLCKSLLAAQSMQLAERSAITPRVKSEAVEIVQSSSKVASDFTNIVSDDESELFPVKLFKLCPVEKSDSAISYIKSKPNKIKEEIPELAPVPTNVYHLVSGNEDIEIDIAGQPLLSVNNCFSHEGDESSLDGRDKHRETRSTLREGGLTLEIRNTNSPEIARSWICWVCFGKFARCIGVERSLFLKHSKSFCPYSKNDLDDVCVDQAHVRLFCPRRCNFVTSDANAFCKHVSMCVKSEEHTESKHFMQIQSSFENCDDDDALPPCVYEQKLERSRSLGASKQTAVSIVVFDDPQSYELISAKNCDDDDALPPCVYEQKLERSRSLGASKQTAVSIVVFDDPQSYELISAKLSSPTPEVARDLELLSALPTNLASRRLPVPKKPVIGQIEEQNLTKRMKQQEVCGQSCWRGEKQMLNEPNLIHSGTASFGSHLMDTECDKQSMSCPDQLKLTSIRKHLRGRPGKDKAHGDDSRYSAKLQNLRQIKKQELPFVCSYCGKGFMWQSALHRHIECQHLGKRPHACTHCSKDFSRIDILQKHLLGVHKERPFRCVHCDSAFDLSSCLKFHMKTKHSDQHKTSTNRKKAITGKKSKIGTHRVNGRLPKTSSCLVLRLQKQKKMQRQCTKCGKTLANKSSLNRHMKIHCHEILRKRQAGLYIPINFKEQMRVEPVKGRIHFMCVHCDKSYPVKHSLKKHILTKHTKDCPIRCSICTLPFGDRYNMKRHENRHTGGQQFKNRALSEQIESDVRKKVGGGNRAEDSMKPLNMLRRPQTKLKTLSCKVCGLRCKYVSTLHVHMRKHSGSTSFQCKTCKVSFKYYHKMVEHMARHTGGRPYKCSKCGDCFKYVRNLKLHNLNVHSQSRSFDCNLCGKDFKMRQYLKNHILRTHKTPCYSCPDCEKSFPFPYLLRNHLKDHSRGMLLHVKSRKK